MGKLSNAHVIAASHRLYEAPLQHVRVVNVGGCHTVGGAARYFAAGLWRVDLRAWANRLHVDPHRSMYYPTVWSTSGYLGVLTRFVDTCPWWSYFSMHVLQLSQFRL